MTKIAWTPLLCSGVHFNTILIQHYIKSTYAQVSIRKFMPDTPQNPEEAH